MDDNLKPPGPDEGATSFNKPPAEDEDLPILSRRPHPYHQQTHELLEPVFTGTSSAPIPEDVTNKQLLPIPTSSKDSTPVNESGTEADDETYVKRLPPSKARLHKGLRGRNEVPSGPGTPLLTPAFDGGFDGIAIQEKTRLREDYKRLMFNTRKRNRELGRRGAEVAILGSLAWLVLRNSTAAPTAALWKNGESRCLFFEAWSYAKISTRIASSRCSVYGAAVSVSRTTQDLGLLGARPSVDRPATVHTCGV